jgi:hypothetical protein
MSKPVVTHIVETLNDTTTSRVAKGTLVLCEGNNVLYKLDSAWLSGAFSDADKTAVSQHVTMKTGTLFPGGWVGNQQTLTIAGVIPDNLNMVRPVDADFDAYVDNGIQAVDENIDEIVFECDIVPTTDIDVSVFIFGSNLYNSALAPVATSGKHNDTIDRDAADAHPISSITGLPAVLDTILTFTEVPVTIAVADWAGGTSVTKTVTGVTADSTQYFEMSKADSDRVADFGVWPTAQATDSLTFVADETPTNDITLNVLILK